MTLSETLTEADTVPQACLSLRQPLSIDQLELSNSTLSPPDPEEGPGQPCYVEGPAMLKAQTPACSVRLISLSLCQRGERGGCQRAQTTQRMWAEASG